MIRERFFFVNISEFAGVESKRVTTNSTGTVRGSSGVDVALLIPVVCFLIYKVRYSGVYK